MNMERMAQAKNIRRFKMLFVAAVLVIAGGTFAFSNAPIALKAVSLYSCTDSDKGKIPNVFGTITLKNSLSGRSTQIADSCATRSVLIEGFCDPKQKNSYGQTQIKCSSGICQRGVCAPNPAPTPFSLTLTKHPSSLPQVVRQGTSNVTLASYQFEIGGANAELRDIALSFVTNTRGMFTGSLMVKVDGMNVLAVLPAQLPNSATNLTSFALSTYPMLAPGKHTITIVGNISTGVLNGSVATAYLDVTKIVRAGSGQIPFDPSFLPTMSDLVTVQDASLVVTTNGSNDQVTVGTSDVTLATFSLNASTYSSSEDIKINSIVISDQLSNGAAYADISNLVLVDAETQLPLTTSASTATGASSLTFSFISSLVVPKTGARNLILKGDVLTGQGTHSFTIKNASDVAAVGKDTGTTVYPTLLTQGVPQITIVPAGGLSISVVHGPTASPANDQVVYVGQSDVPVFAIKLHANTEPVKLTSLRVTVTGTMGTPLDLSNIRLYRGSETNHFASASQLNVTSVPGVYEFTWTATDNILADAIQPNSDVYIYFKANIGGAGQAILGDTFRFSVKQASHVAAIGASSASVVRVTGAPIQAAGVTMIAPQGIYVTSDAPAAGSSITQQFFVGTQLARIKIQNYGSTKITVHAIKFTDGGWHQGTVKYHLKYSDQNSGNYTQNTAATSASNLDFNLDTGLNAASATPFSIDGGSYRYVTVAVASMTGSMVGDTWQLSLPRLGDVLYSATEADLGYDADQSGSLSGTSRMIWADGKPIMGTLVKSN